MIVQPVKTRPVVKGDKLEDILNGYIKGLKENSVVAVTSKIVSICENRMMPIHEADKDELIKKEAQYFLPREENKYNVSLSVKNNSLVAGAGIDESNGNGYYILWPENPQTSANNIREYLAKKFSLNSIGVIITDSRTTPLRWGVTGTAIAHSGFKALKSYIGEKDIFGRPFAFEKLNIADSLAAAAVMVMGEGKEQIPLAVITDIPLIEFQKGNPTQEELNELIIELDTDLYAPLLTSAKWQKGEK